MPPVEIRVRGSHQLALPPERATVHAAVSFDGPAAEAVFAAAAAALALVAESMKQRHHPKRGPVTRYAMDQVRMGSHRPWNNEGLQLPLVHNAAVAITATFIDFDELARWVAWSSGVDGMSISYVEWDLSDSERRKAERTARQKAVRDAARRAQDYADALGLGSVTVSAINDPGLGDQIQRKVMMASAVAGSVGDGADFTLAPEEVEIRAEVEASFVIPGAK